MTQKLFCFGLGYSARNLFRHLQQQDDGWQLSSTCCALPIHPIPDVDMQVFHSREPMENAADLLAEASHILISIPPQDGLGDPVLHHHGADIAQLKNLKWLGYLSTTGVYGDHLGAWVDEETPPTPTSTRGHQRWEAEQGWLKLFNDHQVPVHLFRLGSIYGPGRGQQVQLLKGRAKKFIKPNQYFSRIHVEDITQVLMASLNAPHPGRVYNVVDNLPASPEAVLDYVCDLLQRPHLPAIHIDDAEVSPMMKSFFSENKRVRNDRIRQELGVSLKYPTYKEGFSALVRNLQ